MKIVNRKAFLEMPPGTVFMKYEPQIFGELAVKQESISDYDFFVNDVICDVRVGSGLELNSLLDRAESSGEPFEFDLDSESRDGCFESGQLFAVYENNDILQLIAKLSRSIQ